MKKIIITVSVVALAVAAPVAGQATTDVATGEVLAYPHAGIALAVPKGFEYEVLIGDTNVLRASLKVSEQSPVVVAVHAIPVKPYITANAYANITEAESHKSPDLKDLKILKKTSIPIAGLTGTARLISFTSRKTATIAIRAYFIRKIREPRLRICYLLTVTTASTQQEDVLRVFGTIVKSLKLIKIEPPSPEQTEGPAPVATDQNRGYSLRVPHRWHIRGTTTGVELGITDYTTGGRTTLMASVTVASIDEKTDAKAAGLKFMEMLKTYFETRANLASKLLSESRTKMAGLDAYQVVVQQTSKTPSLGDPSANARKSQVVVQRTICAVAGEPGEEGPQRNSYVLTVFLEGRDAKAAVAMMEKLAGGLAILAPTTQPASAPAAKTGPAATEPATAPAATKPASAPATKPATAPVTTQPASAPVIRIVP